LEFVFGIWYLSRGSVNSRAPARQIISSPGTVDHVCGRQLKGVDDLEIDLSIFELVLADETLPRMF